MKRYYLIPLAFILLVLCACTDKTEQVEPPDEQPPIIADQPPSEPDPVQDALDFISTLPTRELPEDGEWVICDYIDNGGRGLRLEDGRLVDFKCCAGQPLPPYYNRISIYEGVAWVVLHSIVEDKQVYLYGYMEVPGTIGAPSHIGDFFTEDGLYINYALVAAGLVRVNEKCHYSRYLDELIQAQTEATEAGRGMWAESDPWAETLIGDEESETAVNPVDAFFSQIQISLAVNGILSIAYIDIEVDPNVIVSAHQNAANVIVSGFNQMDGVTLEMINWDEARRLLREMDITNPFWSIAKEDVQALAEYYGTDGLLYVYVENDMPDIYFRIYSHDGDVVFSKTLEEWPLLSREQFILQPVSETALGNNTPWWRRH